MSRITVIGGTGYAGSAIVAEAARRGHQVTALSRSAPASGVPGVTYVQGDAADEAVLAPLVADAEVVVAALSPRGALAESFRAVNRTMHAWPTPPAPGCSWSAASPPCAPHPAPSGS